MTGRRTQCLLALWGLAFVFTTGVSDGRCDETVPPFAERDWAYLPVQRPEIPTGKAALSQRGNAVDAFVHHRLLKAGLRPAPAADRRTLYRRVTIDLTGLPPTPEQFARVMADDSPLAYEQYVERLLASPAFGIQWGQHWLDVVRYADSDGFEYDDPRPNAWRYRDWVIRSLNSNLPFDRFVADQLAADENTPVDPSALPALGLHRLGPLRLNAGMQDEAKNRQERLTEIVDAFGSAFLGLTIGCARCHDHMFDPIRQVDYYQLQAFFAATQPVDWPLLPKDQAEKRTEERKQWDKERESVASKLQKLIDTAKSQLESERRSNLPADVQAALATPERNRTAAQKTRLVGVPQRLMVSDGDALARARNTQPDEVARLEQQLEQIASQEPAVVPVVMAVRDSGHEAPKTFRLDRGEPHQPAEEVEPRFPAVLIGPNDRLPEFGDASSVPASTGRRTALANWLTHRANPLTARVIVNRLWQHHFGRGLVETPNNFGAMGSAVTHPDLLDWLAAELVDAKWDLKHIHRLILHSATYRRASRVPDETATANAEDVENSLYWKFDRRRLSAETLRDCALFVSGQLNDQMNGPGVRLPLPPEIASLQYKGTWQPTPDPLQHNRRTIFLFVKRNNRPPFLESFDAPSTMVPCGQRSESCSPHQALALLNSPFTAEQAAQFSQRLLEEFESMGSSARIPWTVYRAYELVLNRRPTDRESKLAEAFLGQGGDFSDNLVDFCLVLLNLDEFLYVD